ncbi:transcriptional regulatory protein ZraR [Photobacterium damselae subsp. piscicida]|nr:VpsR-related response regulator [Photobacterium damselae]OLQ80111.1 sigma-54-dependent Fis family transcriptional regulator [Photobacterium damselae subsp. piscicida]BBC40990.1 transcriptional regulatory protein ZraR [Photobacterium damselae subsp. piscicida]
MRTLFNIEPTAGNLFIFGSIDSAFQQALSNSDWHCHFCQDMRMAESLLLELGPCIGLVDLSQHYFSLHSLANLLHRHKQVRWIALIDEKQLSNEAVCQFIVSFCFDYFSLPIPIPQLLTTIGHQCGMLALERHVWPELRQLGQVGLQGQSLVMRKLQNQVTRTAISDLPVLIQGEIGTGKELVAQAIHRGSIRSKSPFIRVDCRELLPNWNIQTSQGIKNCLKLAHGGVLFLDDIACLSQERQIELLQILEFGYYPDSKGERVYTSLRVIASTALSNQELLSAGQLINELYYRLNIMSISVPPLRERGEDIVGLAELLLLQYSRQYNGVAKYFTEDALSAMRQYQWPGNVRELVSKLKRVALLADHQCVGSDLLELPINQEDSNSLKQARADSEKAAVVKVLENNKNKITASAKELGVSRATMYRLLKKYDLHPNKR